MLICFPNGQLTPFTSFLGHRRHTMDTTHQRLLYHHNAISVLVISTMQSMYSHQHNAVYSHQHNAISVQPSAQCNQCTAISTMQSVYSHQHNAISVQPSAQCNQCTAISTMQSVSSYQHNTLGVAPQCSRCIHKETTSSRTAKIPTECHYRLGRNRRPNKNNVASIWGKNTDTQQRWSRSCCCLLIKGETNRKGITGPTGGIRI